MRRFNLFLPLELFNRIELMAKHYNTKKTKMIIKLLEIGYIEMLKKEKRAGDIENE